MNIARKHEVKAALNEAYKRAGNNAYFANGFSAGVEFATQKTAKRCRQITEQRRFAVNPITEIIKTINDAFEI